jgi:RNA polymerase sigma factor (sigma-70 family)
VRYNAFTLGFISYSISAAEWTDKKRMTSQDTSLGGSRQDFSNTVGGIIQRACDPSTQVRQEGLNDLCRRYWKPVYHHLRVGWAKSNDNAKDLTQAFFLWLVEEGALARFEPQRASFRTFLKSLLRHFVQDQDRALSRLKRGGGVTILALENPDAPMEGLLANPQATDPDEAFHKAWRNALIARAIDRVRETLRVEGRELKFRIFEAYDLGSTPEQATYETLAQRFGLPGSEVQHYLANVREMVRSEIRKELAETVSRPEDLEEEWNAFFGS